MRIPLLGRKTGPGGIHLNDARAPQGMRIYAIGDVHGCATLLAALHDQIDREIARDRPADWRIIHVGDYCDRGPDTKSVLDRLADRCGDDRVIALMGNHDEAFLTFMADPGPVGLFSTHGGEEAARSYGLEVDFSTESGRIEGRNALREAVPASHFDWLAGLGRSCSFGDYFFCHAGIRPGIPLEAQDPEDLIWIRREFISYAPLHPKVIVHGHTPSPVPEIRPNRINIDTHAFRTGVLTALVLEDGEKRFLNTEEG